MAQARELAHQYTDALRKVASHAMLGMARVGEEHHRLELPETIEHGIGAEIGRHRRPYRANGSGAETRFDRTRAVARDRDHAIAGAHAFGAQPCGDCERTIA